jgi:hypothetical protein
LLDPEYLTHSYEDWWERKIGGGRAFACFSMNYSRAAQANELARNAGLTNVQWRVALNVKNYKNGERYQYKYSPTWMDYGFALNSKSNVKDAAIRFIDWFYSDEYRNYGQWDKDDPDNLFRNYHNSSWRNFDTPTAWADFIGTSGWYYFARIFTFSVPVLDPTDPIYNAGYDNYTKNSPYLRPLPQIPRTGDITNFVRVTTDIDAYIETAMDEFVTGRRPFSLWDAYVADVRRMGIDSNVATFQGWYDNYWRLTGN